MFCLSQGTISFFPPSMGHTFLFLYVCCNLLFLKTDVLDNMIWQIWKLDSLLPEWLILTSFAEGRSICVLDMTSVLRQLVHSSLFTISLYRASVQPEEQELGLSQAFPRHVHTLLNSQEYVRASQPLLPMDISLPKSFIFPRLLFAPTGMAASGNCDVKQFWLIVYLFICFVPCPPIVFDKYPGEQGFSF